MPIIIALVVTIIIAIITIIKKTKSPEELGQKGESLVSNAIGDSIPGARYVFHNLVLYENDNSCQIDHVVINAFGVFVIETKNYSGTIYGDETQLNWTQVLAYGKEKHTFYNPVKQNATHIFRLKQILGNVPFRSVIVFVQNNTENVRSDKVVPLNKLHSYISCGNKVLTPTQIEELALKLKQHDKKDYVSEATHVQKIAEQQSKIEHNICPRCNAKLVVRQGKYGKFWGCPNYPKCKFTKK